MLVIKKYVVMYRIRMKLVFLWAKIPCTLVERCLCFGEMFCLYLLLLLLLRIIIIIIIIIIIYLFILVMDAVHCYETVTPLVLVVQVDTSCRIANFGGILEE